MKRVLVLLVVVALVLGVIVLGAGAAFAGEVKGPPGPPFGEVTAAPEHANSVCAFSGLWDGNGTPGRTQSFGQDVKNGHDPRAFNPGEACRGGSNPQNPPG